MYFRATVMETPYRVARHTASCLPRPLVVSTILVILAGGSKTLFGSKFWELVQRWLTGLVFLLTFWSGECLLGKGSTNRECQIKVIHIFQSTDKSNVADIVAEGRVRMLSALDGREEHTTVALHREGPVRPYRAHYLDTVGYVQQCVYSEWARGKPAGVVLVVEPKYN